MSTDPSERRHNAPSPLRPLLVALIAFTGFLAFQTVELLRDRSGIAQLHHSQDQAYAESGKLRQQLNALAGETALLAQQGNSDAKRIVQAFARQGINMSPPKSPASAQGK